MIANHTTVNIHINRNRQEALADLKRAVCEIGFYKLNGEWRVMRCTLNSTLLSLAGVESSPSTRKENTNLLVVWDVEKEDWRSIRFDRIRSFVVEETDPEAALPVPPIHTFTVENTTFKITVVGKTVTIVVA